MARLSVVAAVLDGDPSASALEVPSPSSCPQVRGVKASLRLASLGLDSPAWHSGPCSRTLQGELCLAASPIQDWL